MDNQDILLQLIVRMDNASLEALSKTPLWVNIVPLIDDYFWYLRSQALVGKELKQRPDADWKRIYYTLLDSKAQNREFDWSLEAIRPALAYLPALLVLVEVYGRPKWKPSTYADVWSAVRDVAVFNYLLSRRVWIAITISDALNALRQTVNWYDTPMMKRLIAYLDPIVDRDDEDANDVLQDTMVSAIDHSFLEGVKLLDEWSLFDTEMFENVVKESSPEVLRYLLSEHQPDDRVLSEIVRATYEHDDVECLEILLEYGASLDTVADDRDELVEAGSVKILTLLQDRGVIKLIVEDWEEVLTAAVERDRSDIVMSVLQHLPPSKIRDTGIVGQLRAAGGPIANDIVFNKIRGELAMSQILYDLDSNEELARQLVAGSDLNTWDTKTLRVFCWALKLADSDREKGFRLCQLQVSGIASDWNDISRILEKRDVYSHVLRFLLFREPTAVELADWMIARDDPSLELASRAVLTDASEGDVSLRALMLAMLYPTLSLEKIIERLEKTAELIPLSQMVSAAGLVGAYLGWSSDRAKQSETRTRFREGSRSDDED